MRGRIRYLLATLLAIAIVAPGCKPQRPTGKAAEAPVAAMKSGEARDWVVARLGDRDIPFGELQDVLESLPVFARMRYQSPERRRDFLEAYVQYVVLGLAAESEGYGKDPVVLERLKADLVDRFLRDRVDLKVRTTDIPEPAILAWYEAHPHEFKAPVRRRIAHLLLKDRATAEKIAFRVRKTLEDTDKNPLQEWERFVQRLSEDPVTKGTGGDLGLFPRLPGQEAGVPEAVVTAALGLSEPFQVSGAIEAGDGFHVLFLRGQVPAIDETLEQARPRIVERLLEAERARLREALLADLARRDGTKVNEDVAAVVAAQVRAEADRKAAKDSKAARAAEGGAL